jgi:hypothetical protein
MPIAPPDRVRWFIETYASSGFRHAAELVPIMSRNDPAECEISYHEHPEGQLPYLGIIYRLRAKRMAAPRPSRFHPPGLAADVAALADRFDRARDQTVRAWQTLLPSGTSYCVWELVGDAQIAGCEKSADQPVVNPDAR